MRYLFIFIMCCASLSAVETDPVRPARIIDANTLGMSAQLAGQTVPVRVALQFVATPPSKEAQQLAKAALGQLLIAPMQDRRLLPVVLSTSEERFSSDDQGRILAIVSFPKEKEESPIPVSPLPNIGVQSDFPYIAGETIQEYLVRNGLAVYTHLLLAAPEPLHSQLLKAQEAAQQLESGLWKDSRDTMQALAATAKP